MPMLSYHLLFGIIAILHLTTRVRDVTALECFVCSGCNDPFDEEESSASFEDCEGSCMKTKAMNVHNTSAFGHPPPSYNQYNEYSSYPPQPGTGNNFNDMAYPPGSITNDHPPPYTGPRF